MNSSTPDYINIWMSIQNRCQDEAIKVTLDQFENITGSEPYFCPEDRLVYVPIKNRTIEEWLPDLIHEYGHVLQFLNDCPVYGKCDIDGVDAIIIAELWIDGHVELTPTQNARVFGALYDMERLTEDFTIEFMEAKYFPNDLIERYRRDAIRYCDSYLVASRIRQWQKLSFTSVIG